MAVAALGMGVVAPDVRVAALGGEGAAAWEVNGGSVRRVLDSFPRPGCYPDGAEARGGALMTEKSLNDRYKLVRLIGEGGMGSVYEAIDVAAGQRVAIKVIHDDAAELPLTVAAPQGRSRRFDREARTMMTLSTPHILSVLDAGAHPTTGAPYLVTELLDGEDLQRTIDRIGPLPPPVALAIVAQACLGLSAAHALGVVHRDIKPANLFLARRPDGEIIVKILDFGVAKILRGGATPEWSFSTLTDSGTLIGSPLYMSPEQLQTANEPDGRTDVWGIGSALYCALAGRAPHADKRSFVSLVTSICNQAPVPLREIAPWVSPEVAAVVERAMEIDPARRFPSALAMVEALRPLLPDGSSLREEMITGAGYPRPRPSRPSLAPEMDLSATALDMRSCPR
jgi:serine/threonine protein kinase